METKKLTLAICYLAALAVAACLLDVDGGVFALVDIGLLPLFIFTGFDIETKISDRFGLDSNGIMGACIGGGVGNLGTDMIGAALDPTMWGMIVGIMIFGTLSLAVIYIIRPNYDAENEASFERYIAWKEEEEEASFNEYYEDRLDEAAKRREE